MVLKIIHILNIDNFFPEMCELTMPLIQEYAANIGAEEKYGNVTASIASSLLERSGNFGPAKLFFPTLPSKKTSYW